MVKVAKAAGAKQGKNIMGANGRNNTAPPSAYGGRPTNLARARDFLIEHASALNIPEEIAVMTPVQIMMAVAQISFANGDLAGACRAASAAAPYLHPRLSAIYTVPGADVNLDGMSTAELKRLLNKHVENLPAYRERVRMEKEAEAIAQPESNITLLTR